MNRPPRGVLSDPLPNLLWVSFALIWLTWSPFQFGTSWALIRLRFPGITPETIANFLLLAPLAVNVAEMVRRSDRTRHRSRWIALIVAGAAAGIEAGQLFVPGRVTSLADWILNTGGGALAASLWLRWSAPRPKRSRWLAAITVSMFLPVLLLNGYALFRLSASLEAEGWSSDATVALGHEVGGLRTFAGTVEDASVCTEGLSGSQCLGPLASLDERRRFNDRVRENQHVRLSASIVLDVDRPRRLGQVISYAEGTGRRNATIGVQGRDLVFRLRTPFTGPNGTYPEFSLRNAVPLSTPVRVRAEYHRGEIALSSEGPGVSEGWRFRPSLLTSTWTWTRARRLPGPPGLLPVAIGAGALFILSGLIVGGGQGLSRPLRALAFVAVGASLPLVNAFVGLPPKPEEVVASLLAYALGRTAVGLAERRSTAHPTGEA